MLRDACPLVEEHIAGESRSWVLGVAKLKVRARAQGGGQGHHRRVELYRFCKCLVNPRLRIVCPDATYSNAEAAGMSAGRRKPRVRDL